MTFAQWATVAVSVMTLLGGFFAAIRFLVKHYLYELRPNGGGSLKDKVTTLEEKVDLLTDLVKQVIGR